MRWDGARARATGGALARRVVSVAGALLLVAGSAAAAEPGVVAAAKPEADAAVEGAAVAKPARGAAAKPEAAAVAAADLAARCEAHLAALRPRLPPGFSAVLEPPFVVLGNEPAADVARRAEGTVRWAVRLLKQDFFAADPAQVLEIWLFRDDASYRRYTRELFGDDDPGTPYGYFSARHGALIMNISTGGGTLVHELVHPFVAADFPGAPAWLNEGLGSLYEQSEEKAGHIHGRTNWRLAGLQEAIRAGKVPPFETLLRTSSHEFYEEDPGTNYAQARYLLYSLQERGLLVRFYREARRDHGKDPTGLATLRRVLGEQDLVAFQRRWEREVLALRFP